MVDRFFFYMECDEKDKRQGTTRPECKITDFNIFLRLLSIYFSIFRFFFI